MRAIVGRTFFCRAGDECHLNLIRISNDKDSNREGHRGVSGRRVRPMSSFASMQSTIRGLCQAVAGLDPPINPRLREPASEEVIRSAEQRLGMAFPRDLRHLLLCHNGQDFWSSEGKY